jgi:hypothetical protein
VELALATPADRNTPMPYLLPPEIQSAFVDAAVGIVREIRTTVHPDQQDQALRTALGNLFDAALGPLLDANEKNGRRLTELEHRIKQIEKSLRN